LLFSFVSFSQQGFLFVKKGFHKKRVYTEGDFINVKLKDGSFQRGIITLLRNDTIFINDQPVFRPYISEVVLKIRPKKPFPVDAKTMLIIAGGAALATGGLIISKQATVKDALIAGPVIGFAPLLIKHFGGRFSRLLTRKKFRVRKKFHLQVLEFHLQQKTFRPF
jgi:hypothetical protein